MTDIIFSEIRERGPISFARFMELALYHPERGYYERAGKEIGKRGDFFTSVSVGSFFGGLLARQFAVWLGELGNRNPKPGTVQLVEAGAHNGQLARDILTWLKANRPQLLSALRYVIVEPSAQRQAWQHEQLRDLATNLAWCRDLHELDSLTGGVRGIIFSNELLDAFLVHRLGWSRAQSAWFEWGVMKAGDALQWAKLESPPTPEILGHLAELPRELLAVLPDGFTTETCPSVEQWWHHAAGLLCSGKLMTIDYGLSAEQFLSPERSEGTLRAYDQHRLTTDVLARPGEQDLTAHVNFTAIQRVGESAGLRTETFATQEAFLTQILTQLNREDAPTLSPGQLKQFQTLTHPGHLGRQFRVLVQEK